MYAQTQTYRNRTRFRNGTTFDEKASRMKSIAIRTRATLLQKRKIFFLDRRLRNINISASLRHTRRKRERQKTEKKKKKLCEPWWPLFN